MDLWRKAEATADPELQACFDVHFKPRYSSRTHLPLVCQRRVFHANAPAVAHMFNHERFTVPENLGAIRDDAIRSLMVHHGNRFDRIEDEVTGIKKQMESLTTAVQEIHGLLVKAMSQD